MCFKLMIYEWRSIMHHSKTIKDINHQVKYMYVLLDVIKIWMSSPPFAPNQYKQVTISTAYTMYIKDWSKMYRCDEQVFSLQCKD